MALRDLIRGRLALRIYLVGLAQFALVVAGFVAIVELNRPNGFPHEQGMQFVNRLVARKIEDPTEIRAVLDIAQREIGATISVFDAHGTVLATNASAGPPPCIPLTFGNLPARDNPPCNVFPLRFPDGTEGRIEYIAFLRPPPIDGKRVLVLVLVVVGISSWLLARTLTRPLGRLSTAALAFGRGDFKARAALPNRDELGEVSRAFDEMAERVTELLRAERELLANVSHELRTPLSRIRIALELVSEAEGDLTVVREMLGEIRGDLDELERLISDVLMAARLDFEDAGSSAGIPPLRRQRVDVHELLMHAATRFRAAHPDRPLRLDVPSDLPSVDADPVLLRRVFDNLLENAHKYTDKPDEPIQLVARLAEDITIDVIDKGIGIATADLPRVFRPFYRADRSRTRATGGLGLGLPLAKRIVDAHGGTIGLTSAPNEGTCVRVRLPMVTA